MDNASGVAAVLGVARAFTALPKPPRRIGLLRLRRRPRSRACSAPSTWRAHPPVPAGRIAADINIDGANIFGRTRDITLIGLGKSPRTTSSSRPRRRCRGAAWSRTSSPTAAASTAPTSSASPSVGVPAAYFDSGTDVVGKPEGWGRRAGREVRGRHVYHQPSDELDDDVGLLGRCRGRAPRLPPRLPHRRCGRHAHVEERRRVRGRAEAESRGRRAEIKGPGGNKKAGQMPRLLFPVESSLEVVPERELRRQRRSRLVGVGEARVGLARVGLGRVARVRSGTRPKVVCETNLLPVFVQL